MKSTSMILAAAALAIATMPAEAKQRGYKEGAAPLAPEVASGPLKLIYRFAGVTDSGDAANVGVATAFHCRSVSPVTEKIKININTWDGSQTSKFFLIESGRSLTASTHLTAVFFDDIVLDPGKVQNQGSGGIFSTAPQHTFCSAMIVDASVPYPEGIALHMTRYNAAPGTQE